MRAAFALFVLAILLIPDGGALAASGRQPAPEGAYAGAPPQYTRFSAAELERGFLALAFGSDLRIGPAPRGIRRFDRPIRATVIAGGSVDRSEAMARIINDYARKVPNLRLSLVSAPASADIELRLIDEKDFDAALTASLGAKVTADFVARTNPECMTSVASDTAGGILRATSFIVVDKGDRVFFSCAYHELLHAFGLSNHDRTNPWTTLNQNRKVGYLSVYDRALLTVLYDRRILPGMTTAQTRALLPQIIKDLALAAPGGKN
jgi:hypothetical protein